MQGDAYPDGPWTTFPASDSSELRASERAPCLLQSTICFDQTSVKRKKKKSDIRPRMLASRMPLTFYKIANKMENIRVDWFDFVKGVFIKSFWHITVPWKSRKL